MRAPKGQNFLYQAGWQRRVAAAVGPSARLLEIGGGPGGLSALLAEQSQRFWVVESDPRLAQGLRERFGQRPGVTVIEADILQVDLSAVAGGERLRVAGNLPYYITSPILLHLYRHAAAIEDATVMVQREVADRLVAGPGTRAFGLLTATTQLYARARRLFDLPPGAFRPAPQVHSSLVRLDFAPRAAELGVEAAPFLAFLRRAFAHKRKQLAGYLVDPARAGLPARARAEELGLEQLARLYRLMPVE
ncbi:MAG TPA: 16S rRNA (adenine(1518)-N(6)/adenine(1519)-N(6))-dimethyltransferase RsmA [Terriglobales bacterium]|nr:16S rRNA (adenine(1518)-N(6)/adenine(1519)-N(6))-dimethyltransferase RsmA [Terriglobales bacterium]